MTVRLRGVDAPEMRTVEGVAAKQWVVDWLDTYAGDRTERLSVLLVTFKDKKEKYGRYLGDIYAEGQFLNDDLVDSGHAKRARFE